MIFECRPLKNKSGQIIGRGRYGVSKEAKELIQSKYPELGYEPIPLDSNKNNNYVTDVEVSKMVIA